MHHHLVLFAFEFSKVGNLIPLENYLRKYQKGHIMLHINFSYLLWFYLFYFESWLSLDYIYMKTKNNYFQKISFVVFDLILINHKCFYLKSYL